MNLRDPKSLPRLLIVGALVAAPLAYLLSTLVAPPLEADESAQLVQMAAHSDRTYLFALLTILGSALLVPAIVGVVRTASGSPWLAYLGGGLAELGLLIAVGDSFGLLWEWQLARGSDRGQMAALLHRFDAAGGISLIFAIGGLALVVGCALLGVALWRTRTVPRWAAVALPVGAVVNIVGFGSNSRLVLDLSALVLLAALVPVAMRIAGPGTPARASAQVVPGTP